MPGPGPRGIPRGMKPMVENPGKIIKRLLKYMVLDNLVLWILVAICIVTTVQMMTVQGTLFTRTLIDGYIIPLLKSENPDFAPLKAEIFRVAGCISIGIVAAFIQQRIMVHITQGFMRKLRDDMFGHMETLPIKYFDTHVHGDIMSLYTNDVDTMRQMISQSVPQLINSTITIVSVLISMIVLNAPLTLVSLAMIAVMLVITKNVSKLSGKFFGKQQKDLGALNGYIEEMMSGQKVIKVFCHEEQTVKGFDGLNTALCDSAYNANRFANIIGPLNMQIGNVSYVVVAIVGGLMAIKGFWGFSLGALASFLTFNRNLNMPINQISMQVNAIIMALAGGDRIFRLMDEKSEIDEGYVTLVNARRLEGEELAEFNRRAGEARKVIEEKARKNAAGGKSAAAVPGGKEPGQTGEAAQPAADNRLRDLTDSGQKNEAEDRIKADAEKKLLNGGNAVASTPIGDPVTETAERTGLWAWKHYHKADGTTTYVELKGDVVFDNVDFGYTEEKMVLHDIKLFATPGQKIAFVGSTGAGKTTITNLINRFYDIQDGKIRYDGINVNKIKKADLRRSLGIVLQETHLFTGTVMDNIRYGKLDATDEEVIAAAKLANAHSFIRRLPDGYNTMLTGDGANLSQGQRQLLAIARAAVADPPVLILDEATSSIDTRTEKLVQEGMDKLMKGRTTFVIAHRLSTVKNSDCIMVLEQGRIIERGSHDELIAEKGKYYQLYTGNSITA